MESTTVRYDFSFPPKSQANNGGGGYQQTAPQPNNYRHQNNNQHFNMSKSVSSSLLSCATTNNYQQHSVASTNSGGRFRGGNNTCYGCTGSNRCQYHHHRNYNRGGQQQYQYQQQQQQQQAQISQSSSQSSIQTVTSSGSLNGSGPTIVAPGTPKDGNCSFTFDELKNTLSFMDDSPLVNTSSSNTAATTNTQTMLTVNPGHAGEGLSMHSGGSSSSGISSASHVSSSSNQLPKSISNPMILSSCSSASSLSAVSTSPVSMNSSSSCGNGDKRPLTGGHYHHHHQHNNRHSGSRSECGCNHHNQANNQSPPSGGGCSSALPPLAPPSSASSTSSSSGRHTVGNSEVYMRRSSYNESASSASSYDNQQPAYHTSLIQPVSVVSGSAQQQQQQSSANSSIETAAKKYRFAAQNSEATCHWSGKLPPKQYKPPLVYSTKVFVGGLPWDICENDLLKEFGVFGPCRIEFTNKDRFYMQQNQSQQQDFNGNDSQQGFRHNRSMVNLKHANGSNIMSSSSSQSLPNGDHQSSSSNNNNNGGNNSNKQRTSPGFAYVIYDNECSVRSLVGNCIEDYQNGRDRVEYYYKISTRRVRNKEVQIIPWILADNNFATCTPKDLDPKKTVFVGNLHGTMTARDLAHIMNELFGSVVYAGIDIDKLKYPIGSGRVTFAHQQNFMRAVRAAFVDINSFKFAKRIQIDPYLEDVQCCLCMNDKGIYFCRDFQCFNYYCGGCWEKQHSFNQMGNHKPLMRKREDKY